MNDRDIAEHFDANVVGLKAGVISEEEYRWLQEADSARNEVIAVDAFSAETFKTLH